MVDLSIVITAHSEGIIAHKTLLCLQKAVKRLEEANYSYETLVHLDKPDEKTLRYIQGSAPAKSLGARIYTNDFGDPSSSRNFAAHAASGRYITFIDADDLFSDNWLADALKFLKSHEKPGEVNQYVAHPHTAIEFGAVTNVIVRQGEIDRETDSLLSVYANRWNVVLMIDRRFLVQNPYDELATGYGFEDWGLNCKTIYAGMHNVLVPETCLFVRRKTRDSVWSTHRSEQRVLAANPLLSFAHFRTLPAAEKQQPMRPTTVSSIKHVAKRVLSKNAVVHKAALGAFRTLKAAREVSNPGAQAGLPSWLIRTWQDAHETERSIFPLAKPAVYQSVTPEHWKTGLAYRQLVAQTSRDSYDYIVFLPWLVQGGADNYTLNYIDELRRLAPGKHMAVVAMLATDSPWKDRLDKTVDFIDFGNICDGLEGSLRSRLLEQFVENSGAQWLHVINAAEAYEFLEDHRSYIQATSKKVVLTSFSQSIDSSGKTFGYSHTHVPSVYDLATVITSDNQTVLNMWQSEYGFESSQLALLRQPVPILAKPPVKNTSDTMRILWAARLSPEKQPDLIADIARLLADLPITIDMHGKADPGFNTSFLDQLPSNVKYHGPFDGPDSLEFNAYDVYLYTSLFDGMPNAILEAGSRGLPIIASAVGGIPEIIKDAENGLLVHNTTSAAAYAAAIRKLYNNRPLLAVYAHSMYDAISSDFSVESYQATIRHICRKIGYIE